MVKSYELCKVLGTKLRNLRNTYGDSQLDLTKELNIDSNNIVGLIERGQSSQILMYLPAILAYYGVTFEEFISEF